GRRGGADEHDQQTLRDPREEVLERDGGRVDVREGLVRLVHGEGEEGEDAGAPGRDGGGDLLGRRDVAGEDEQAADPEAPERGDEVAEARAPEGAAAAARQG